MDSNGNQTGTIGANSGITAGSVVLGQSVDVTEGFDNVTLMSAVTTSWMITTGASSGRRPAPNNGPNKSWSCLANAQMGGKLLQAGADAAGALPVAGTVANVAQFSVGLAATGISLANGDGTGAAAGAGSAVLTVVDHDFLPLALKGVRVLPVIGKLVSGAQFVNDVFGKDGIMQTYSNCLNH